MKTLKRVSDRRHRVGVGNIFTFACAAALVTIGTLLAVITFTKTLTHRPFEDWDEISTFNSARVLSGPNVEGEPTYGTIETFIQFAANEYYLFFDPVGRAKDQQIYSNNALRSLDDRYFAFHDRVPFHYFRGVDDHEPIFMSRRIHVVVLFALIATVATALWLSIGPPSLLFTGALLFICAATEMRVFDAWQSIPGPLNVVLCFAIAACLWAYARSAKPYFLYAAALCFALGLNLKMDLAVAGTMFPVACLVAGRERRFELCVRDAGIAIAIFAVCLVATDPWLLISPAQEGGNKLRLLLSTTTTTSADSLLLKNWPAFAQYIQQDLLPREGWPFVTPVLAVVLAGALPLRSLYLQLRSATCCHCACLCPASWRYGSFR